MKTAVVTAGRALRTHGYARVNGELCRLRFADGYGRVRCTPLSGTAAFTLDAHVPVVVQS